jgi:hypothetical protein
LKFQGLTVLRDTTLIDRIYPLPRGASGAWPILPNLETNVTLRVASETDVVLDYDASAKSVTVISDIEWHARRSSFDMWLSDTLGIISRELDGAENDGLKNASEALAYYFAAVDFQRRPQLMVDDCGTPSFATVTRRGFYFHLTVDTPERLSFYAVDANIENYAEGVCFDHKDFPKQLKGLLLPSTTAGVT